MKTPDDRFWAKVDTSGDCWVWTASTNRMGYGFFWYRNRNMRAHRASYLMHVDEIPDNLFVLHSCDNPSCVRPNHLFLGTQLDNVQDCISKGRFVSNPKKRNQDLWNEVVRRFLDGQPKKAIARAVGIAPHSIRYILRSEGIS